MLNNETQELDQQAMCDQYFSGIPNEDKMPQIHAITSRKMTVL
jgi:hypothetical protein